MRICHVVYSHYPFDPRVRKEAESLAGLGYEVHVIALQDKSDVRKEPVRDVWVHRIPLQIARGGKLRYLYQYGAFFLASSILLLWLQLRHHFRVVHIHSLPDFEVFAALPVRFLGASVVLDLHEVMPELLAARFHLANQSFVVRLARGLEKLSCAFANRVVVVAEQLAQLLASRSTTAEKIAVVSNGPDFEPTNVPSVDHLREELHLNGRRVLVHAGGLNPERDLETVLHAAELLSASYPMSLLFYGKGDPAYVRRLAIVAAREAPHVELSFGGWITPAAVLQRLRLADVGLGTYERNPHTEIGASSKALDFVAVDKPLVLADLEGLRAVWSGAALFYRPGDAHDLARQIQRLFEDPPLRQALGSAARRVYDRLAWKNSRRVLEEMYERLGSSGG